MAKKDDPIQTQLVTARRNQILDAAIQVFAEKGFHATTIRDIAGVAGLADGTLYIYFKNKNELLLGILHRLNESELRHEHLAHSTEVDLRSFTAAYMRQRLQQIDVDFQTYQAILPDILNNPELRTLYYSQVIEPTFALAEGFFTEWATAGLLKTTNVALTMRILPGMVLGLLVMRMLGDATIQQQWDQLAEVLTGVVFDGLTAK